MKFYAITAALIAALALVAACIGYWCLRAQPAHLHHGDTLAWLRTEFSLSPEQTDAIARSHAEYALICERHCELIRNQQDAISALEAGNAPAADLEKAREEARQIDAHCMASVKSHVQEIAAIIGGEQGQRYLQKVLPRLAEFDHANSPDLRLSNNPADASQSCH